MHNALILALLAVLTLTRAMPISRRELGGVLICDGANAQGHCEYGAYELDKCYDLAAPLYQNASTFAPDGEAFYCYPYATSCGGVCTSPTGCTLGAVSFFYEHKFDLGAVGWEDGIASFECHRNETTS
ncbi:hypothetical protein B0H67DRAFT_491300 [Lasiosphaeris hirsuta]|uniref:Uncharacterized protein n=1 Tax=Lasiosphaeris hirsuta TaxID=260670 RepID=A0AA40DQA4_9PEZI|nr:hypothetical protein B0H67DRAFT_491300 [Lasiosphaeris hirsuta]